MKKKTKKKSKPEFQRCKGCGGLYNGNVTHNHTNPRSIATYFEGLIEDVRNDLQKLIYESETKADIHENVEKYFEMMQWRLKKTR